MLACLAIGPTQAAGPDGFRSDEGSRMKRQGMAPDEWVTDKNPAYGTAR